NKDGEAMLVLCRRQGTVSRKLWFNQLAKIFLIRSLLKISWIPFPERYISVARGLSSTVSSLSRLANYCCLSALFFVIGHDCAHKSFSQNKLVEDIVGTLAFLPLVTGIYIHEALLFYAMINSSFLCILVYKIVSVLIGVNWHLNLRKRASEVNRVKISLACVYAFMAVGVEWPTIIHKVGILGWVKFWLMPWLGYHFWINASLCSPFFVGYTIRSHNEYAFVHVHDGSSYASTHSFQACGSGNVAQVQLNGNILCHDINVHIPHDMSPRIHNYNLCAAHESIQENWGKYTNWLLQLALVEDDNES
ncbi:hypothetical protein HID58_020416, partial [Brassica napus]